MSLFSRIMSYLGWCPSKTAASQFPTHKEADAQSPITKLNRKFQVTLVVLVALVAVFPFPHQYVSDEELVKTMEINTYLSDGESLSEIWNLRGVNIVRINISCSKDILVHLIDKKALKGQEYKGLFARVSKVHGYDCRVNITNVMEVKVLNPAWIEDDPAVPRVRGSIEAYRISKTVWLPWWWQS